MLRRLASFPLIVIPLLCGCANSPPPLDTERPPTSLPSQEKLIGTWRLISLSEPNGKVHPAESPFFCRFYPDGQVATWPTPVAPVSRGEYRVMNGLLTLPSAPSSNPVQLRLTDKKMWYWNDDGGCLYYRVAPDLEPGCSPSSRAAMSDHVGCVGKLKVGRRGADS